MRNISKRIKSNFISNLRPLTTNSINGKHFNGILTDSYPVVWDLPKCHDSFLVNKENGEEYLDFHCGFGRLALGWNHPKLIERMSEEDISYFANKPANSDIYTDRYLECVKNFKTKVVPDGYDYLFFIDGGALAVENALKTAMDWKMRKFPSLKDTKVMYFENAFHGRTGYTMSLTNTDPIKTMNFAKFRDWIKIRDPPFEHQGYTLHDCHHVQEENDSLERIESTIIENTENGVNNISAMIIEPIQCEGGDRYFSENYLKGLQNLCYKHDILFIVDEVQTGFYTTGYRWLFEKFGLKPDIVSFSKKTRQGGIFASSERLGEVDNVFETSSRINSTWGGGLADLVGLDHTVSIVEEDNLCENAKQLGEMWSREMYNSSADLAIHNIRSQGLIMAFDMSSTEKRNQLLDVLFKDYKMLGLGCGTKSVRFRPNLSVSSEEIEDGLYRTVCALRQIQ